MHLHSTGTAIAFSRWRRMAGAFAAGVFATAVVTLVTAQSKAPSPSRSAAPNHTVTPEQYDQWKKDLSNWGRWGKDDEIGTMNLVTAAKRREAAALVKEGFSVSLIAEPDTVKAVDNADPYEHEMRGMGIDRWGVWYHGVAHTHLDSLAHISDKGVFYNGYTPDPAVVKQANGHSRNSIHNLKNGVLTRGILIDVPRLKSVPYLEPGTAIYVEDIEAWERQAGVKVGPGDAVFFRTGVWARRKATGPYPRGRTATNAGLDPSVLPWLKARDVAIVGSEHPLYVLPSAIPGAAHDFSLVYLGIHLVDNADLDALSEAAAARKRWTFMLTMAPIPIAGGTGSPINPIATF
jgi:kynurenine formamidase